MKKIRLLALLCALLLIALPLFSCGEDEAPTTEDPPAATPGGNGNGSGNGSGNGNGAGGSGNDESDLPNTDPDYDPDTDADLFLSIHGYPMGLKITFTKDHFGFDTASNTVLNGSNSVQYQFTADDLRDLYNRLDNCNFRELPTDLTYSTLTGSSAPSGAGAQYVLTVSTTEHGTKTCRIDAAAIERLSDNADVANLAGAVNYFYASAEAYRQSAA